MSVEVDDHHFAIRRRLECMGFFRCSYDRHQTGSDRGEAERLVEVRRDDDADWSSHDQLLKRRWPKLESPDDFGRDLLQPQMTQLLRRRGTDLGERRTISYLRTFCTRRRRHEIRQITCSRHTGRHRDASTNEREHHAALPMKELSEFA